MFPIDCRGSGRLLSPYLWGGAIGCSRPERREKREESGENKRERERWCGPLRTEYADSGPQSMSLVMTRSANPGTQGTSDDRLPMRGER